MNCNLFVAFFHVLAQFSFTTNHTELNFYHQRVNVWVAGRLKTEDLGKLGNFKEFPDITEIDGECTAVYLKPNINNVVEKFQKLAVK